MSRFGSTRLFLPAALFTFAGCGGDGGTSPTPAPAPVASVTVSPGALSLTTGQTGTLTVTLRDASGNALAGRPVAWTSSDRGVATVSDQGTVTGVSIGEATITATAEGRSGAATVTVTMAGPIGSAFAVEFRPAVVSAGSPGDVLLIVDALEGTLGVSLRRPDGVTRVLQRQPGTRRYILVLTAAEVLESYVTDPTAQALRVAFQGNIQVTGPQFLDRQVFVPVRDATIPPATVTQVGANAQRGSHIVNIRYDGLRGDNGSPEVVRRFYQAFTDNYDFLSLIWLAYDHAYAAYYTGVRNSITGTGVPPFDFTNATGAEGTQRLVGLLTFPNNIDLAQTVVGHEIGHCCINALANTPLSTNTGHWPLSTTAFGVMGLGGPLTWLEPVELPDGRYRVDRQSPYGNFTELELYLLGLLPGDSVPPQVVFPPQDVPLMPGAVLHGPVIPVTLAEIAAANGPRVPAYPLARSAFRMAAIVISRDRLLTADEMAYYEFMAGRGEARVPVDDQFGRPFYVLTGGRATLSTAIP